MIARLVVVFMVGALGISVPAWTDIPATVKAAHSWTADQFAAWDGYRTRSTGTIEWEPIPEPSAWERPATRAAGTAELIAVVESPSGLADELNRASEGLEPLVAWAVERHETPRPDTQSLQPAQSFLSDRSALPPDTLEHIVAQLWHEAIDGANGETEVPTAMFEAAGEVRPSEIRATETIVMPTVMHVEAVEPGRADRRGNEASRPRPAAMQPWRATLTLVGTSVGPGWTPLSLVEDPPAVSASTHSGGVASESRDTIERPGGVDAGLAAGTEEPVARVAAAPEGEAGVIDPLTAIESGLRVDVSDGVVETAGNSRPAPPRADVPPRRPAYPVGIVLARARTDVGMALRLTGFGARAWLGVVSGISGLQVSAR